MKPEERNALVSLVCCPYLERSMLRRLYRGPEDAVRMWKEPEVALLDRVRDPHTVALRIRRWRGQVGGSNIEQWLTSKGIECLLPEDTAFPKSVLDLADPPVALFAVGKAHDEWDQAHSMAIVGTRRASSYGLEAASWISRTLSTHGFTVVSGLALGIDGAAHESTIESRGRTAAVMACGPDLCYPPTHRRLWENIKQRGVIYSEYAPGTTVAPYRFPERNRLIAALSKAIIVVQAGEKSGALVTAEFGIDLGRDIYVVPGPITSVHFRGAHRLLQDGARLLVDPQDLLMDFGFPHETEEREHIPKQWEALYNSLESEANAAQLAGWLEEPISHIYAGLLELELAGLVVRLPGGGYRRKVRLAQGES